MSSVIIQPSYHLELIDGREVEKPLPKKIHAFVQAYLIVVLARDFPKKYSGPNAAKRGNTPPTMWWKYAIRSPQLSPTTPQ